jgi:hypothetical protein
MLSYCIGERLFYDEPGYSRNYKKHANKDCRIEDDPLSAAPRSGLRINRVAAAEAAAKIRIGCLQKDKEDHDESQQYLDVRKYVCH